jgi:hypothetical protein
VVEIQQGTAAAPSIKVAAIGFGVGLVVAALVFVIAVAASSLSRPATGALLAVHADPLTTQAAVQFRASERALNGTFAADPSLTDAAIEFRAGERDSGATGGTADPLRTQQAIDFRADERAVGR